MKDTKLSAVTQIHGALADLSPDDQRKTIRAVLTLLEIDVRDVGLAAAEASAKQLGDRSAPKTRSPVGALAFFDEKEPRGKLEEIAVAARFREQHEDANEHQVDDLRHVFKDARRDFPSNFPRDLGNSKKQGYFNHGKQIVLSHYGQKYVDALPDREKARKIVRPRARGGKRGSARKAGKRAAT